MNIIRTKVIELSSIQALAYKIKLSSGGSGIKIHRTDRDSAAFAEIDKRTGATKLDSRADAALFPQEALEEAVELLSGLPYSARGKVKITVSETADENEIEIPDNELPNEHKNAAANVVDSDEFAAITAMYTDINGKINYPLMNKQFIQFASKSKTVSEMIGKKASDDEILLYIVKNRSAYLAGKKETLSDEAARALIETMDDIDPRSAFKELKLHIRKMLSR